MLRLTNVLLGSHDPERLTAFYSAMLGEPTWEGGGWVGFRAGPGFVVVGPHADVTSDEKKRPGAIVIGFETDDVEGECERLQREGAIVLRGPFHPVDDPDGSLAFLADPDGNVFQLMRATFTP